jgi:hypothetical protein
VDRAEFATALSSHQQRVMVHPPPATGRQLLPVRRNPSRGWHTAVRTPCMH